MLYAIEQPLHGASLLREPETEPLVAQVRALLDAVEREQVALPGLVQPAFAPWLVVTRRWIDGPANAADHERLREILDRLRAYRVLIGRFAERER